MQDYEPTTSPSLLLRVRNADDGGSWAIFVDLYAPMIRRYCRRRGIQESDVDDLVQEIMTLVSQAIRKFDYEPDRGRFRAWFSTIITNRVKTFLSPISTVNPRSANPADPSRLEHNCHTSSDLEWDTIFLQEVLRFACDRIRHRFEAKTWSCFEMTWLDQQSASEVATFLELSVHTVYVNKSRVLQQLEREILFLADDFPCLQAADSNED